MVSISSIVRDFCVANGVSKRYWVAFSGGLDSHVLLHALSCLREEFPIQLTAVHVHHGLSPHADHWVEHCHQVCKRLDVNFVCHYVSAKVSNGESPEEKARSLRYSVFSEILKNDQDCLLTAHHSQDQAETLLLQLMRGAGPKGLSAMPFSKKFGNGWLMRPFLKLDRAALLDYAKIQQLHWVEDESNQNTNLSRNFIRHQLLPLIQERWPAAIKTLSRAAQHCATEQTVLNAYIQEDLLKASGSTPGTLSVYYLKSLSFERKCLLLREWLSQKGFLLPPTKKLEQLFKDLLEAGIDKNPTVHWQGVTLRRYREDLYADQAIRSLSLEGIRWNLSSSLMLPGIGELHARPAIGEGLSADISEVVIRFRQGGEKLRLPGRSSRHSLKKLFQEWGVLPWERDRIPLIYVGDALAAVAGYVICEGFLANNKEKGYLLALTPF